MNDAFLQHCHFGRKSNSNWRICYQRKMFLNFGIFCIAHNPLKQNVFNPPIVCSSLEAQNYCVNFHFIDTQCSSRIAITPARRPLAYCFLRMVKGDGLLEIRYTYILQLGFSRATAKCARYRTRPTREALYLYRFRAPRRESDPEEFTAPPCRTPLNRADYEADCAQALQFIPE